MNRNQLYESMGYIDDQVLERSERRKGRRRHWWTGVVAAVLVAAVGLGIAFRPGVLTGESSSSVPRVAAIQTAVYPAREPYPDESKFTDSQTGELDTEGFSQAYDAWWESNHQTTKSDYTQGLDDFFRKSIPVFLSGKEGENTAYSPLNVYMALAILAELTDGSSRQQVLDLLGADEIQSLRSQANDLWNAQYQNDGATTSILASSLWMREDISYVDATMETLAENYYASSFQGEMGSQKMNQAMQDWINQQTGGYMEEQTKNLSTGKDTVLALATTLYFQAKWNCEFQQSATKPQTFHSPQGDREVDFMHASLSGNYYWGDHFGAVRLGLQSGGEMWFLLPDQGVTPEQLLNDSQAIEFLISGNEMDQWERKKNVILNLSVPKYDITSDTDLKEGMATLGITDALDPGLADFSPTSQDVEPIYLSQVQHGVRASIDEEGVTAAAYTVMAASGGSEPPGEEVDFVLDRPFLFTITGQDGLPLFVGIVNEP